MDTSSNFIIFSLPRVGSSFFYSVLLHHLESATGLHEYFNPNRKIEILEGVLTTQYQTIPPTITDRKKEMNKRLSLLLRHNPRNYIMKLQPSHISSDIFDALKAEQWICIERRDVLDQFLSYAIAKKNNFWNTNKFYELNEYKKHLSNSIIERKYFEIFKMSVDIYNEYKCKIKSPTIYYEDIIKYNTFEILSLIGLKTSENKLPKSTIKVLTKDEKINLVSNLDEVKDWICELYV